jgi:hypothetical protein
MQQQKLLGEVFSVWSMPRLYKEDQLRLRESLETTVRRVRGWCEVVASLGVNCERVSGQYGREHGSWGNCGFGSRYQATTSEDTADWEDLVRAVVNSRVCESAMALQLLVVRICKLSKIQLPIQTPYITTDARDNTYFAHIYIHISVHRYVHMYTYKLKKN